MTVEIRDRTEGELSARNQVQRELLGKYLEEGKLSATDPEAMSKIFRQISDILDGDDPVYDSIRAAFKSGDHQATVDMLKTVVKV
ncbi:MAG: hypothetical protein WC668_02665 [Patescibacteria group bacterium]|jgi:hypothetical protein